MIDVRVRGMTCDHCVQSVRAEILRIDGVQSVAVDLTPGDASVVHVVADQPIEFEALAAAIDEAGYDIAHD
jgi:copper chaperone CopZ